MLIEAPSTDQLRISLRRFMAEHRHEGLADIVIDISDDADDTDDLEHETVDSGVSVSLL